MTEQHASWILGLASLLVSALFLRLVCTNGMVTKTEIYKSYRHVSTKILIELTLVFETVTYQLGKQRNRLTDADGYKERFIVNIPLATKKILDKMEGICRLLPNLISPQKGNPSI